MPRTPTSPRDGQGKGDLSADAIVAKLRRSISINRAWTECPCWHPAKQEGVALSSPTLGIAAERSEQPEVATPANPRRCLDHAPQTRSRRRLWRSPLWRDRARFRTSLLLRAKCCLPRNRLSCDWKRQAPPGCENPVH